ncbi:hypothetical protein EJB05_40698 [Eragrostis curvula]|uniref:Uncharacterized protein n=1 Tax=Eragrostis curvula TaxID=38414 RepID=A0A5J9TP41_9POAL|nr:hypothetical protein EJB05_40698 [Eragrostis curvula]
MKKLHLAVLLLPLAALAGAATDFDFFFHVQLWPASHCSGADSEDCCYVPVDDKPPADFTIAGFRPNYASCQPGWLTSNDLQCWPASCNVTDSLHPSLSLSCENRNPMDFWSEEWSQHGTCSNMDQHSYFRAALDFKARFNLTRILLNAGGYTTIYSLH